MEAALSAGEREGSNGVRQGLPYADRSAGFRVQDSIHVIGVSGNEG